MLECGQLDIQTNRSWWHFSCFLCESLPYLLSRACGYSKTEHTAAKCPWTSIYVTESLLRQIKLAAFIQNLRLTDWTLRVTQSADFIAVIWMCLKGNVTAFKGPDDRTAQSWGLRCMWLAGGIRRTSPTGRPFDLADDAGVGICSLWARAQSRLCSTLSLLIN